MKQPQSAQPQFTGVSELTTEADLVGMLSVVICLERTLSSFLFFFSFSPENTIELRYQKGERKVNPKD